MADGTLYIGTKRYSSWSLRGWLAVRVAELDVEEVVIALAGGTTPAVKATSPSGFVPFLVHRGVEVWDSLAICEYCAEIEPALWPEERGARAHARAISAEMHSGFRDLRMNMPMSLFRDAKGAGMTEGVAADIERIDTIWSSTRQRFGEDGPFLFGADFTAADAMYAPVVCRFLTYQPTLSEEAREYCAAVRAHPLMEAWYKAASIEPRDWFIPRMEQALPA